MKTFDELYRKIKELIRTSGKLIICAKSDWGADVYELKGIKVAFTDVGYGSQIYSESFHYWADYSQSVTKYSANAYNNYIKDEDLHIPELCKILEFLKDAKTQDWKDTLDESFWLEKFKKDWPETHIYNVDKAIKYKF